MQRAVTANGRVEARNATGKPAVFIRAFGVAFAVIAAFELAACTSRSDSVLGTLPQHVVGVSLDTVTIVNDQYPSGHPVDDVLRALSKTRRDGGAVFRSSSRGSPSVGGIWVDGVDGAKLLDAVVNNWLAAAVIARTTTRIDSKDVWLLEIRPNHLAAAYSRGDVVYIASSDDRGELDQVMAALP